MLDPENDRSETEPIRYGSDETYGDEGYVWPYKAPPRRWDHTLNAYPPGPGRPKGTKKANLSGQVFHYLTVIERIEDHVTPSGGSHPNYRCRCVCGASVTALGSNLEKGRKKTCGCKSAELRAAWREEEREIHRQHYSHLSSRYESWKVSDKRPTREQLLRKAERSLNGL